MVGKVTESIIFLGHILWSFFKSKKNTTRNWKNKSTLGRIRQNYSTHPPLSVPFKIIHDAENLWLEHTFCTKNTVYITYLQSSWTIEHIQWVHLYHKPIHCQVPLANSLVLLIPPSVNRGSVVPRILIQPWTQDHLWALCRIFLLRSFLKYN